MKTDIPRSRVSMVATLALLGYALYRDDRDGQLCAVHSGHEWVFWQDIGPDWGEVEYRGETLRLILSNHLRPRDWTLLADDEIEGLYFKVTHVHE